MKGAAATLQKKTTPSDGQITNPVLASNLSVLSTLLATNFKNNDDEHLQMLKSLYILLFPTEAFARESPIWKKVILR